MDRGVLNSPAIAWILAAALAAAAVFPEGGRLSSLFSFIPAFLIIALTAFAAGWRIGLGPAMLALRMARELVLPPADPLPELARKIFSWGMATRRDGLLALGPIVGSAGISAVDTALGLMAKGIDPDLVREGLEQAGVGRMAARRAALRGWISAVRLAPFAAAGVAAPGVLDALRGGSWTPACVALLYGVVLSRLVLLPLVKRLRAAVEREAARWQAVVESLMAIAHGEGPEVFGPLLGELGFNAAEVERGGLRPSA